MVSESRFRSFALIPSCRRSSKNDVKSTTVQVQQDTPVASPLPQNNVNSSQQTQRNENSSQRTVRRRNGFYQSAGEIDAIKMFAATYIDSDDESDLKETSQEGKKSK